MAELIGSVITTDEVTIRDVRSYVRGVEYPVSVDGLYNMVCQMGANQFIRAAVGEMSGGIYNSESDVVIELSRLGYA